MFNDSQATFPETKFHVGRWLGPAVDVGSDLTSTVSQRGYKFALVFATSYGWSLTIPMTKKSDTPFALDSLFRHEGVPPKMIMDGSKEQNLGDFARKLRDAGFHRKQIEPHSHWMNLCEGEIRELKRGSTRKMLK